MKKRLSIVRSAVPFFIGLRLAASDAKAQTWVGHQVTTNITYLTCIASSADGSKLVVGSGLSSSSSGQGPIALYVSADFGATWQVGSAPSVSNNIETVVSSADGTRLGAAGGGALYLSSDSGSNWTQAVLPNVNYPPAFILPSPVTGLASSADGMNLVTLGECGACAQPAGIYHSSDGGVTWTVAYTPGATNSWGFVTSSADGVHLAATSVDDATHNPVMYLSGDSGASWQKANAPILVWTGIASSADGSKLVAVNDYPGSIYASEDFGVTWQLQFGAPTGQWTTVASSADGTRLFVGDSSYEGSLYMSADSGVTWYAPNTPTRGTNDIGLGWYSVACSADGVKLAAISEWYAVVVGTVSLADINVTVSATPTHVDLQDMIRVTLTITNESTNTVSNVQVSGSIGITGNGGVSLVDISGLAIIDSLPPGTNASITYEYEATNYGFVTFSATVKGQELGETIYSLPGYSSKVAIFPTCDLMVKTAATNDTTFLGVDEFQQSPTGDQSLRLSVGTNGVAAYDVRVQNDSSIAHTFVLTGTTNSLDPGWNIQVLSDNVNILGDLTSGGWTTPSLDPGDYFDLQVTLSPMPNANDLDTQSVKIDALPDSINDYVLDAVLLHAQLVPVAVQVNVCALNSAGLTAESIQAGQSDIDAPLVPVTDPDVLGSQPQIAGVRLQALTPKQSLQQMLIDPPQPAHPDLLTKLLEHPHPWPMPTQPAESPPSSLFGQLRHHQVERMGRGQQSQQMHTPQLWRTQSATTPTGKPPWANIIDESVGNIRRQQFKQAMRAGWRKNITHS